LVGWWGVQTKLPGRKFQSHPGVPPARLIELPPACDTLSKLSTGDAHMDIEDGIRSGLEKCVEKIPEKGPRLNSVWWTQLERYFRL
jgi:hypothetical protein